MLVGYDSSDDASVYRLNDEMALIQTIDFFPSMVEDPYLFGQISAANALSDVYAMGGTVISALNIVTYPDEESYEILGEILQGGADKVHEANAVLSGGHSIHDSEAKYGLSVTGIVHPDKIIRNNSAKIGDVLIITKPIGVGIITTGYNSGQIKEQSFKEASYWMTMLNRYAAEIMVNYPITSSTDVTGFGILGHLKEMLNEDVSAEVSISTIPYLEDAYEGAKEFLITAGAQRNRNFLTKDIQFKFDDYAMEEILLDPQTSGGLIISIPENDSNALLEEFKKNNVFAKVIGKVIPRADYSIIVKE